MGDGKKLIKANNQSSRPSRRGRLFSGRLGVFYQYLLSYTGLVILACSLLGLVLFNHYVRRLSREVEEVNRYKLSQIASDLDSQYEAMQDAALEVAVSIYYKPYYLQSDKTHEQDLLDDFIKFSVVSPIADDYFLFYFGEERLYKKDAKNSVYVYFRDVLRLDDYGFRVDEVRALTGNAILRATSGGQPVLLFAFPVNTLSIKEEGGRAVLCFVTGKATLETRARNVAGELTGRLALSYGGETAVTLYDGQYGAGDGDGLTEKSQSGWITVSLSGDERYGVGAGLDAFRDLGLLFIICFSAVLLGLGVLLAYGNYRPIKRLGDMECSLPVPAGGPADSNELDRIGSMLRFLADSNTENRHKLKMQLALLSRQIVNVLINDGYGDEIGRMARAAGMNLAGGPYTLISIDVRGQTAADPPSSGERFLALIETAREDGPALYPGLRRPNGSFTVLAVLAGPEQRDKACGLIRAAGAQCLQNIVIGVSGIYSDLNGTPAAYLESQTALNMAAGGGRDIFYFDQASASDALSWYDNDQMLHLLKALKMGREEQAREHLQAILSQLRQCPRAVLIERHVCSSVLTGIVSAMRDLNLPLDNKNIITAITMHSLDDFDHSVTALITDICVLLNGRKNEETRQLIDDVLEYIGSHFTEYDMGLKRMEERFGMLAPQLSLLIRDAAGESFKSYLTRLRMERAKRLLLDEGRAVHEVSAAVGYGSVSHFIRTFTKYAGCTPAQFKDDSL